MDVARQGGETPAARGAFHLPDVQHSISDAVLMRLLMSIMKLLQIHSINILLDSVALYISPLYLIYATVLLLLFEQISIENIKVKNMIYKIASTTLGIYIIQMHPLVYRRVLIVNFISILL